MNYAPHPLAEIFPLIQGKDFVSLKQDIKEKGLLEPIWIYEGRILDGRNRFKACQEVGVDPKFREYVGTDPRGFVLSLNLERRHLDESQRAIVAAKLANMNVGGDGSNQHEKSNSANLQNSTSQSEAADMLNVSTRSVSSAKKVLNEGDESLISAVEVGKVSISVASDIAELTKEDQQEVVAKGEREILQKAKEIRAAKAECRRKERIEKIVEISMGNADLNLSKTYPVILCDPPWRYEYAETESRAIENQYPTMSLEEICDLPVNELASEDSVVFMWTTSPKLEESFKVLNAWGFTYKTCAIWDKEAIGMGYYFRQQHELLLVGSKGSLPTPSPETRVSSVIREKRGPHSAKPEIVRTIIEDMYPELQKIELFCRDPKEGWDVWGNQSNAA